MKSTPTKNKESLMEKVIIMTDAEKKKSKVAEVTQSYKQTESEIKSESQKLRIVIDLQEKKLLDELESVADKEIGQLKADIKTVEMRIQSYQQQSELIDHVVQSDCEMDICKMYRSYESGMTESEDYGYNDLNKETVDRISLRKNTDQLFKVINDIQLGEIEVTYEGGMDLKRTPVLQDTINVTVAGDQYRAYPVDVTVLDVNGTVTVVVTDRNNKCVKSFYSRNNQPCHSKLGLYGGPWGLTQLKHNQVVVTVEDNSQIVTVEVNPDLKMLSTFKTKKKYLGIAALTPSTIAVGSRGPPSVDILDMTGTRIRSLTPSIGNKSLVQYPYFLCTTKKGNILVSGDVMKSVLCVTPQGDVVFNYSPTRDPALKHPMGITVTDTGDILVADRLLNNVFHLTESGQRVRNILTSQDGLSRPHGLFLDKHCRLYVCKKTTGVISVFSGYVTCNQQERVIDLLDTSHAEYLHG